MTVKMTNIRRAKINDATAIADVHLSSWRGAYSGLIPYTHLEQMIARRGAKWWSKAIQRGTTTLVADFGGKIAGYTTMGLNRARTLPYDGEVFELYVLPEHQGTGLGRQLLGHAREILENYGLKSTVIWVLKDNVSACEFYEYCGATVVAKSSERFGDATLDKLAYAWPRQ